MFNLIKICFWEFELNFYFKPSHTAASSLYFHDGIRPIDFVIVWDEFVPEASSFRCSEMRKVKKKSEKKFFRIILCNHEKE